MGAGHSRDDITPSGAGRPGAGRRCAACLHGKPAGILRQSWTSATWPSKAPIGAGKSALAERLATRLDATVVLEDTENPFLGDFYADRPGAALQSQLFYLLNRHRQLTALQQTDLFSQITICDYLFDKDKIFAYLNLDDNELFIYQRLYDLLAPDVPPPDLVVYLQAPPRYCCAGCGTGRPIPRRARCSRTPTTCAS